MAYLSYRRHFTFQAYLVLLWLCYTAFVVLFLCQLDSGDVGSDEGYRYNRIVHTEVYKDAGNEDLAGDNMRSCADWDNESDVNFQKISEDLFIYSAFWDSRLNEFDNSEGQYGYVRIMVLSHKRNADLNIYCFIPSPGGSSYGPEGILCTYYEMTGHYNRSYRGYIISCRVPQHLKHPPCSVLISLTEDATSGTKINVKGAERSSLNLKTNFSICVPPLHGEISPFNLIEWVELSTLLGANHIYVYDSLPLLKPVLHYYREKGIMSVLPWVLPTHNGMHSAWNNGQAIAMQDCLYRNMGSTRYVMLNRLDEFMVPHSHANWNSLLAATDTANTCGFIFSGYTFNRTQEDSNPVDAKLFSIGNNLRTATGNTAHTGLMLKPDHVFETGIHRVSRLTLADCDVKLLDLPVAAIHHYRVCPVKKTDEFVNGMLVRKRSCGDLVEDNTIKEKYGEQLVKRVNGVVNNLYGDV